MLNVACQCIAKLCLMWWLQYIKHEKHPRYDILAAHFNPNFLDKDTICMQELNGIFAKLAKDSVMNTMYCVGTLVSWHIGNARKCTKWHDFCLLAALLFLIMIMVIRSIRACVWKNNQKVYFSDFLWAPHLPFSNFTNFNHSSATLTSIFLISIWSQVKCSVLGSCLQILASMGPWLGQIWSWKVAVRTKLKFHWSLFQTRTTGTPAFWDAPRRPMITILVIHIRSQVKTRQSQSYKF